MRRGTVIPLKDNIMSYKENRQDFEFLQSLSVLYNTVKLEDMRENLMQNPTKKTAAFMYRCAIRLWLDENEWSHGDRPEVKKIKEKYL